MIRSAIGIAVCATLIPDIALGEPPTSWDYVIRKGDTCLKIAVTELGDRKGYRQIHALNPNLGATPHRLKPGQVLRLPRLERDADAKVTQTSGDVDVRGTRARTWSAAGLGMDLYRAWRVRTQEQARALLRFRDSSRLAMRQDSVVIIYGPRAKLAKPVPARAELRSGSLRSRLAELTGEQALVVETPSSEAELGAGSSLVSVDGKGATRVANHGGRPAQVRGRRSDGKTRGAATDVSAGMGSRVDPGKAPTPPRELPPTPRWKGVSSVALVAPGRGATIFGRWHHVAKAKKYRVEVSTDPEGMKVVGEATVSPRVTAFEMHDVPAGTYYLSVSSIDWDAFESVPAPRQRALVAPIRILRGTQTLEPKAEPGPNDALAISARQPPPLDLRVGDALELPDSFQCRYATQDQSRDTNAKATHRLTIARSGPGEIQCTSGDVSASLAVDVAHVDVELEAAAGELVVGQPMAMRVIISGPTSAASFRVRPHQGVVVTDTEERRDQENQVELLFTATAKTEIANAGLEIVGSTHAGDTFSIAKFPLDVASKAEPARPRPWTVGGYIGLVAVDEVGDVPFDRVGAIGVRGAFDFARRFSLSAELGAAIAGVDGGGEQNTESELATLLLGRLAAAVRVIGSRKLGLWWQLGGSFEAAHLDTAANATSAGLFYGGTLRIQPGDDLGLRVDVRHTIVGDLQHAIDAFIGFEYRP